MSYLNTKPLIYGFQKGMMQDKLDLVIDYPANIAAALLNDQIDIGLVPVAIIPELKEHHIISDYCIAADGEVASVCLFSEVPLEQITTILLDYQSRTSVALLKILLKEHWDIQPELVNASANYEADIVGTTAGLVIGDRAFAQRLKSTYSYDLAQAWKDLTGLPFVFAAWVSNKALPQGFVDDFNRANALSLQSIDQVVAENPYDLFDLKKYYTEYINYHLTDTNAVGLQCFINKIH